MKRRTFLEAATATAAGTVVAPYVHAQSKKFAGITLRINGYGGLFDQTLAKHVGAPLEEKYGLKVQVVPGIATIDLVKLVANRETPPYDLFLSDNPVMLDGIKGGVFQQIRATDVPNIKRILPGFREFGDYGAPFNLFTCIPVYNSKFIKKPLTSYSDIARPDLRDRCMMMASSSYGNTTALLAIADENGGSVANMDPAFKVIASAKPNIVAFAQTTVAGVQMFQNEEVYAGIFFDARAHELRTKGVPIVSVVPQKIVAGWTYINVVKDTPHREAAYAYINQLLSDEGMLGLPEAFRTGVTTDVKVPEEIRKDMLLNTPERMARVLKIDWEKVTASRNAWIERFNKEVRT